MNAKRKMEPRSTQYYWVLFPNIIKSQHEITSYGCLCSQTELYSLNEVAQILTNLNPIY